MGRRPRRQTDALGWLKVYCKVVVDCFPVAARRDLVVFSYAAAGGGGKGFRLYKRRGGVLKVPVKASTPWDLVPTLLSSLPFDLVRDILFSHPSSLLPGRFVRKRTRKGLSRKPSG